MHIGHERQKTLLLTQLKRGALSHAYLFTGASGIGKRAVAEDLTRALLCKNPSRGELGGCGQCEECLMIATGTHPDILRIESVAKDGAHESIGIEAIRALKERAASTSFRHGYKVFIVDDAAYMTREASNSILKVLEEPPGDALCILITSSGSRILPTIRSRVWQLKFWPSACGAKDATAEAKELGTLLFFSDAAKRIAYANTLENDREVYRKVLGEMICACKSALETGFTLNANLSHVAQTTRHVMNARELLDIPYSNPKLIFESLMLTVV